VNPGVSVRALIERAAAQLPGDEARREAELLLLHVLDRPRAWLYAHAADALPSGVVAQFDGLLARRAGGEPLAYVTGEREFWSLPLAVSPAVLIPRHETERLVELALERVPPDVDCAIADLGTGSGAIALALAHERPQARVLACDASAAALAQAQANAARLGLGNVEFVLSDWFAAFGTRRFDLVVSNPPYIAADDAHLTQGDLRFEPAAALAAGADGLEAIRRIARDAPAHLAPGAWLLFEHGWDQGAAARAILAQNGFVDIFTATDLEQRERVSGARAGAPSP